MEKPLPPKNLKSYTTPMVWDRFWARSFDTILYLVPLLIITPIFFLQSLSGEYGSKTIATIVFWASFILAAGGWVFVEASLLNCYGTTPGKKLLNIQILDPVFSKLSYRKALKRTFKVYSLGCCLGLPLLNLGGYLYFYYKHQKTGECLWDKDIPIRLKNSSPDETCRTEVVIGVTVFWAIYIVIAMAVSSFLAAFTIGLGHVLLFRYQEHEDRVVNECYKAGKTKQFCEKQREQTHEAYFGRQKGRN